MHAQLYEIADDGERVIQLAERIAKDANKALREQGVATLAPTCGSTPIPLFDRLAELPLEWSQIYITQVDERWVDKGHQDSNARPPLQIFHASRS